MILTEDTLTKQNLAACNRLLYVTKETSCDTEISIITVNVLIDSIRIYLSSTQWTLVQDHKKLGLLE